MPIKISDKSNIFFLIISLILIILSVLFAKERIIFTDTAVYLDVMIGKENYFIATNRFVSVIGQILPMSGILLGASMKSVVILYSLNLILIPIICAWISIKFFRNKSIALSIFLFYTLMSMWVFYYPVSEFQIGLCFLLLYHAFIQHYFRYNQKPWLFYSLSIVFVSTIIFSHPLSVLVFFSWIIWLLIDQKQLRKIEISIPVIIAVATYFIKENYFRAMVGTYDYEGIKKEGLNNFNNSLLGYFDAPLVQSSLKAFLDHYFIAIILVTIVVIYLVKTKRYISTIYFLGILLGFWILIVVSFQELNYDHYPEHLLQPLPFFIALLCGRYLWEIKIKKINIINLFSIIFLFLFLKIFNGHQFYRERLQWYQNFIDLSHHLKSKKTALSTHYIDWSYGVPDSYWASTSESKLLSSYASKDSVVILLVRENLENINNDIDKAKPLNRKYYDVNNRQPYLILDSVVNHEILDSLKWANQATN